MFHLPSGLKADYPKYTKTTARQGLKPGLLPVEELAFRSQLVCVSRSSFQRVGSSPFIRDPRSAAGLAAADGSTILHANLDFESCSSIKVLLAMIFEVETTEGKNALALGVSTWTFPLGACT